MRQATGLAGRRRDTLHDVRGTTGGPRRSSLIGRDGELLQLSQVLRGGGAGLIIAAAPGLGRSRMAQVAVGLVRASGRRVIVRGMLNDPKQFAKVRPVESRGTAAGRPVIVVDDAHLLDGEAVSRMRMIAASGRAVLVMTVASEPPVPEPLVSLWRDGICSRLELRPLTRQQVEALTSDILDGPMDHDSMRRIYTLSQGSPLYLTEFLRGALSEGTLTRGVGERWSLQAGSSVPSRLAAVVSLRIPRLDERERWALDLVAIAGSCGPAVLAHAGADRSALRGLEEAGLLRTTLTGRRFEVSSADAMLRAVILQGQGGLRQRAVRGRLAEAILATGERRLDDPVRRSKLLMASGLTVPPDLMPQATRNAAQLLAFPLARQLAPERGIGPEQGVIRARALLCSGRWAESLHLIQQLRASLRAGSELADRAAAVALPAIAAAGRTTEALALGKAALRSVNVRVGTAWSLEREELTYLLTRVHLLRGDAPAAALVAETGLRRATVERRPIEQGLWAAQLAEIAALQGDAEASMDLCAGLLERPIAAGRYGELVDLLTRRSTARALLDCGRPDAAASVLSGHDAPDMGPAAVFGPEPLVRVLAADGRASQAVELARTRVRAAEGAPALELQALFQLAGVGFSPEVAPRAAELASACDTAMAELQVAHVLADAQGDPSSLRSVSRQWLRLGWRSHAQEALERARDMESRTLRGTCERAGLTAREFEASWLAAQGMSSKDIASRLFLSVRTVDNYLGQVYRKLGIRSRTELRCRFDGD